ncbi:helix-turn-helix transcriptional regulator [Bacillus sp. AGMB 02131]|uniref:Helix-turn-helix transcriptional regulator n=1 Tax=Peribacillus faecalis TaxID=2772559 RepID=A0A927HCL1_9BACI|nr:AraC family transcriptional regulator [Peribacillus faecalis]MBD3110154.1 helix-turn-helix transcriptional regulator [Peribacillus faecalis]
MIEKLQKICRIIASTNKLDVRFINHEGHAVIQFVQQSLPATLQNFDYDHRKINKKLKENPPHSYYYYINNYRLQYIATGIWENNDYAGAILVGPFLSSIPEKDFISNIILSNQISINERKQLEEFYQSLSVVSNSTSSSIGELLVNLCSHTFINGQLITSDIVLPAQKNKQEKTTIDEKINLIEIRYQQEQKLIQAIMKGDKEQVEQLKIKIGDIYLENRIPESPIRASKNLVLVLNTICRFAAKKGGVHPVYIHEISDKFAILIERAPNLPYLNKMIEVMLSEYCDLVKEFATRKYSDIVKKAIDYIQLHLDSPLSLQNIAAVIHTNPSHLSRKFKQETELSITDFINLKRVESAKLFLQNNSIPITDIAFMVGFNDVNYFSRVFKKITSLTPSQYAKAQKKI